MYLLYIDFDKKATIILCKLRDIASIVRWQGGGAARRARCTLPHAGTGAKCRGVFLYKTISFDKYNDIFSHFQHEFY